MIEHDGLGAVTTISSRRLAGTSALVTGAGRGLGRAIAASLAQEGARVLLTAEHGDELQAAERELKATGFDVRAELADLRGADAATQLMAGAREWAGSLQVLVNNAGVLHLASIDRTTDEQWEDTLAVNLTAAFRLMRAALPLMTGGGSIVNVSSRAGVEPFADESAYCAAKFGLEGLTRAAARDLLGRRISVNTVTPGLRIKPTGITADAFDRLPEAERAAYGDPHRLGPAFVALATLRGIPTGRRFDAWELARRIEADGLDHVLTLLQEQADRH